MAVRLFACDTPVFRYAMERWESSPYEIKIVHKRDLNSAELDLIKQLKSNSIKAGQSANLLTETINLTRFSSRPKMVSAPASEVEIQISYPLDSNIEKIFWQTELNDKNVNDILNSETRELIGTHLTNGSPIVWLFIEGKDSKDTATKLKILTDSLKELEQWWIIPRLRGVNNKPKILLSPIVTTKPDKNNFLQRLLLSIDEKMFNSSEPVAFPFYGQGRALSALTGDNINHQKIKEQCDFIMGKCSCIVKEQNPGVDVLFNTDWTRNLGETWIEDEPMPKIGGFSSFIEEVALPELVKPEPKMTDHSMKVIHSPPLSKPEVKIKSAEPTGNFKLKQQKQSEGRNSKVQTSTVFRLLIALSTLFVLALIFGTLIILKKEE